MGKMYEKQKDLANEMSDAIKAYVLEKGGFVDTQECENGRIHGYVFDAWSNVDTLDVKAVRVRGNVVEVFLDEDYKDYGEDELRDAEPWEPLFDGDVLGWFTAVNIVEGLGL